MLSGTYTVVQVITTKKIKIRFDSTGFETWTTAANMGGGKIKDPLHRSLFDIGFIGIGPHKAKSNGRYNRAYYVWKNLMCRCYGHKSHEKHPTYKGCYIGEEWHNFQNFAEWYYTHYVDGYELDKDILTGGAGTCYSPENCCFVPKALNLLVQYVRNKDSGLPLGVDFVKRSGKYRVRVSDGEKSTCLGYFESPEEAFNIYKQTKERIIKEKAEEYRTMIAENVYEALINIKINQYHHSKVSFDEKFAA